MLVEDSADYRKVIERSLKHAPSIELVNQFGTAEIALQNLHKKPHPDIILLDLRLPGISGIEAIPEFLQCFPSVKIIMLTQSDKESDVLKSMTTGASGYLLKSSTSEQIITGIETVMDGGASLDGRIAQYLLQSLKTNTPTKEPEKALSKREVEILHLMADGLSRKEIAHRFEIGITSVVTYINRIYIKLEVPNAPAAVKKAFTTGILHANDE